VRLGRNEFFVFQIRCPNQLYEGINNWGLVSNRHSAFLHFAFIQSSRSLITGRVRSCLLPVVKGRTNVAELHNGSRDRLVAAERK
jgi:hypothetical protein